MNFDLQRFGGNKGGSSTSSYEPTPEERRLINAKSDYAEAIAPNALWLNDIARQVLENSLGTVQVDYNAANRTAQERINNALNGLQNIQEQNALTSDYFNKLLYDDIYSQAGSSADKTNEALAKLADKYGASADETNAALARIASQYGTASNSANTVLAQLADGVIPTNYQNAMTESIRSALKNTLGSALNSLGQRGVLNSSVTTSGLNDISKNAADAVAQMYGENIDRVGNLTQTQLGNTNYALGNQATLTQQQLDNINNALGAQGGLIQQQFGNTESSLSTKLNALQAYLNNNTQKYNTAQNIYNSLIQNSTAPVTAAAAAQEAAQSPALNLWNASIGLNGSGNQTLSAISGRGTTTTTTNNGSGGFWGGLFSGASNLGSAAIMACFPGYTKVIMADGRKMRIDEIEVGDKVMSGSGEPVTVIRLMKPTENYIYEVAAEYGTVETTPTQSFMQEGGEWVMLKDFGPCMVLKNVGPVRDVSYKGVEIVYDFETDGENTYQVDGGFSVLFDHREPTKRGFVVNGGGVDIWEKE